MNRSKSFLTGQLVGVVTALALALIFYGTPANAASGPHLVKDINRGFADSNPTFLTDMNGTLYFAAKGGSQGRELWQSDGTSAGTRLVKDIRPGKHGSDPADLSAAGGKLYFSADDGVNGRELWVSDGSATGTRLVRNINPGAADSNPTGFTAFKGAVYFSADDGSTGRELWRTDGTASGTRLVSDIEPGLDSSNPASLIPFAGKLFFLGECQPACSRYGGQTLYRTNGTASGTKPFRGSDGNAVTGYISSMSAVGGRLYFEYYSDASDTGGLWRSKGTPATTLQIADLSSLNNIADVDGTAFIEGDGQIWTSHGTAASTVPVKTIDSYGGFLWAVAGNKLFFDAEYSDWWHAVWVSDGTADGTQPLKSVYTGTDEWASIGSDLYFAGTTHNDYTLWRSDGTADGTYSVGGTEAKMWDMTAAGNSVYWVSDADNHGNELWRYTP